MPRPPRDIVKARKPGKLTEAESVTVATLLAKNYTVDEVAEALQVSATTVMARCRESRELLGAAAMDFAGNWRRASAVAAEKGDHRPAMQALQALDVVKTPSEKVAERDTKGLSINIGFTVAGVTDRPKDQEPKRVEGQRVDGGEQTA